MAGIVSYGAYIPRCRLGKETAGWGLPVEKSVANFDEDSITMAVAAGIDCVTGLERSAVDALLFATTTSPYIEKQGAAVVAAAIDLRRNIIANDNTNSLRAGTLALRSAIDAVDAGTANQVVVTAADCRMAAPHSEFDRNFGDGAASLLIGNTKVIANIVDSYSVSDDILDIWRVAGDSFVRTWEDRFILETGYLKVLTEAVSQLMQKCNLNPKDIAKAAFYGPNPRRHAEISRKLGFNPQTQVQDPLFGKMGNTGTAHALMLLIAALEEAKPGDKILLASYGDGADAYLLEVTSEIEKFTPRRGIKRHLESKQVLLDNANYLRWHGLMGQVGQGIDGDPPSVSARWREREEIDRLHGTKCKTCGLIQYPSQRVCTKCHTKDNWETVRLSDKKGKIFTFSLDYITSSLDMPLAITIIDFEGGGRGLFLMTDLELSEVHCEAPVEMSFRKMHSSGGVHNYFWKAIPPRV